MLVIGTFIEGWKFGHLPIFSIGRAVTGNIGWWITLQVVLNLEEKAKRRMQRGISGLLNQ